MQKHRKIMVVMLLIMALALAACSRSPFGNTSGSSSSAKAPAKAVLPGSIGAADIPVPVRPSDAKEMSNEDLAEYLSTRVVRILTDSGSGSGFFIDGNGTLVTNYHVIDGASSIMVEFKDGAAYTVDEIVDFSHQRDIAVLKVHTSGNDYLRTTTELKQGQSVVVYGSPRGMSATFTAGVLSSTDRKIGTKNCFQYDASTNPGNSGGPVVNNKGQVLGIASMTRTDSEGINYAIKISELDSLAMNKNYTISRYQEWYTREVAKSYRVRNGSQYENSLVNTYTTIVGQECIAALSASGEVEYDFHNDMPYYVYGYSVNEYDAYCDYLRDEMGFEFVANEVNRDSETVFYQSMSDYFVVELTFNKASNLLFISAPYYI